MQILNQTNVVDLKAKTITYLRYLESKHYIFNNNYLTSEDVEGSSSNSTAKHSNEKIFK